MEPVRVSAALTAAPGGSQQGGMNVETTPSGTQCLDRAVRLLKVLATRDKFGWGLTDLSRRSGIDKATVHRILGCLEMHRLVDQNPVDRRYFPGPLLVELGFSVSGQDVLLERARDCLARIVERTGAVALFYLRSGADCVVGARRAQCAHRGMLADVGCRRPMVMAGGGVAMLVGMPEDERRLIVGQNVRDFEVMGVPRPERFHRMLERSLELGFAANLEDVVVGINSYAVCLHDAAGAPYAAVSVAGDTQLLPSSQAGRWADILRHEATVLEGGNGGRGGHSPHSALAPVREVLNQAFAERSTQHV